MIHLELDYEQARSKIDDALVVITDAMDEATDAKDRALVWIHVSEWMASVAAGLFSGVVLWWLMVRRSLYREISTTELRQA